MTTLQRMTVEIAHCRLPSVIARGFVTLTHHVGRADAHALLVRAVGLGVLGHLAVRSAERRSMLETDVESAVAIRRESIGNVERHADAATATLHVHADAASIACEVDDDGVGLAVDAPPPSSASRVRALGGWLRPNHGPGARLSISLPRP